MGALPIEPLRHIAVMTKDSEPRGVSISSEPKDYFSSSDFSSMLVPSSIDVVDGEKLVSVFTAASTYRRIPSVVDKRLDTYSLFPISYILSDNTLAEILSLRLFSALFTVALKPTLIPSGSIELSPFFNLFAPTALLSSCGGRWGEKVFLSIALSVIFPARTGAFLARCLPSIPSVLPLMKRCFNQLPLLTEGALFVPSFVDPLSHTLIVH